MMKKPDSRRTLIISALFAVACAYVLFFRHDNLQLANQTFLSLGTLVNVKTVGTDAEEMRSAIKSVEREMNRFTKDWHAKNGRILGVINQQLAESGVASLDGASYPMLKRAFELCQNSRGAFDPAVGELVALWGFDSDDRRNATPPARAEIFSWQQRQQIFCDGELSKTQYRGYRGQQLDLGAFAKGVAVENAIANLREQGIDDALVDGGGDLKGIGSKGDKAWRVGVRHPRHEGMQNIAVVSLEGDEAIFTSGDYERFFTDSASGQHYHHILDPRTGMPASGIASVTVIHADAGLADAASTALFVAGVSGWPEIANSMDVHQVMVITADGDIQVTHAMNKRVYFNPNTLGSAEPTVVDLGK